VEETTWRRTGRYVLLKKCYSGDKIKKTGWACSAYGGELHTGFSWGNRRETDHLEDLDIYGE
jgi:hypothetical protein